MLTKCRAGRRLAFASDDLAFRAGRWAKAALLDDVVAQAWCARNGLTVTRAAVEGVNAAGGFLVPDEILARVIELREQYGAMRATAQIVPMSRESMSAPRQTSGL